MYRNEDTYDIILSSTFINRFLTPQQMEFISYTSPYEVVTLVDQQGEGFGAPPGTTAGGCGRAPSPELRRIAEMPWRGSRGE